LKKRQIDVAGGRRESVPAPFFRSEIPIAATGFLIGARRFVNDGTVTVPPTNAQSVWGILARKIEKLGQLLDMDVVKCVP